MKYRVIVGATWEELEESVNEALAKGWTLQGGLSSNSHAYRNEQEGYWEIDYRYAQAMCEPEIVQPSV